MQKLSNRPPRNKSLFDITIRDWSVTAQLNGTFSDFLTWLLVSGDQRKREPLVKYYIPVFLTTSPLCLTKLYIFTARNHGLRKKTVQNVKTKVNSSQI